MLRLALRRDVLLTLATWGACSALVWSGATYQAHRIERDAEAADAAVPPAPARPLRVLLVDDEPLVRATLAEGLEAHGCRVAEAAGGAAALERLGRNDA